MKKCSFESCSRDVKSRGWCQTHYMQWRRTGEVKSLRWTAGRRQCSAPDCDRDSLIKGQCAKHYKADLRRTEPGSIAGSEERFWSFVHKSEGCWEWTGQSQGGYGRFDGWLSHRYAWRLTGHSFTDGLFLDHKCRNRACVNPDHLHQVSRKLNQENLGVRIDNKTGYRGVTFSQQKGMYVAAVSDNGQRHYLGTFATAEDANRAAVKARLELFENNIEDRPGIWDDLKVV